MGIIKYKCHILVTFAIILAAETILYVESAFFSIINFPKSFPNAAVNLDL